MSGVVARPNMYNSSTRGFSNNTLHTRCTDLCSCWGRRLFPQERFPDQVRSLRRLLLVVAGSLHKRHVLTFGAISWRLLQLADPRVDDASRRLIATKWTCSSECCLAPGFARQLKVQGVSADNLRDDPIWRSLFMQFACVISQQVCDLEWRHGRNRARSNHSGKSTFHMFSVDL